MEEWEEFRDIINEMLLDPAFEYADETLSGILEWIVPHEHITNSQIMAVTNIRESANA